MISSILAQTLTHEQSALQHLECVICTACGPVSSKSYSGPLYEVNWSAVVQRSTSKAQPWSKQKHGCRFLYRSCPAGRAPFVQPSTLADYLQGTHTVKKQRVVPRPKVLSPERLLSPISGDVAMHCLTAWWWQRQQALQPRQEMNVSLSHTPVQF